MRRLENAHLRGLARNWSALRLAVEAPGRFPSWDYVVLTAASERQAALYETALDDARCRGVLPRDTATLVVPDPGGRRIGSGGATLNALRALSARERQPETKRVLLLHSGGDSRRVPWANLFGKVFLPLPLLADPDQPVPTLFDHMLAVAAPLAVRLPDGGLVTLAGDVLPLFDAGRLAVSRGSALVVTTPVPLDLASKHGVIVAGPDGVVAHLLQKADPGRLAEAGALVEGGSALLDTGVWAFTGAALGGLVSAAGPGGALDRLLESGGACSLYEDLAAAFVPANREALAREGWGRALLGAVAGGTLRQHRADEMVFLHFGSTAEVLDHFGRPWFGEFEGRILAETGPLVSAAAHVYESTLDRDTRVGWGSLLLGCALGAGTTIGHRCVVVGLDDGGEALAVPDSRCVWQVPVASEPGAPPRLATLCCGVDDHPGDPLERATFCNRDVRAWMDEHGVDVADLWGPGETRALWFARMFPVQDAPATLQFAQWMLEDAGGAASARRRDAWRRSERVSLDALHRRADFGAWRQRRLEVRSGLVLRILGRVVDGMLDRNLHALASQFRGEGPRWRALSLADRSLAGPWQPNMPATASRRLQMKADLLAAGGDAAQAAAAADEAFHAVQDEVARAVTYRPPEPVAGLPERRVEVRLPVRFDISGGWSDTPPYCLERPALVLNFAMALNGATPVGAEVEALAEPVWDLEVADLGARIRIERVGDAAAPAGLQDPFLLLKTALRITGYGDERGLRQGVRVRTRADVPKGSGLGTSSILGAALIAALQRLAGRPDDPRTVSDLVLVLEQQMRTGGGWQDQVGGLVPGVKCISTRPVRPLRMRIEPVPLLPAVVEELQRRLVVAFTGQQRLARNILQLVVERYLRREARTLSAIARLVELADEGRSALAMGRLDDLGSVLGGAWEVLQQLTPECSNPHIDALFREVEDLSLGGKLAGAGGGGFLGVLAKDAESAGRIRERLRAFDPAIRVYPWSLA